MREKQPFAVVGSNIVTVDKNGRKVRGRKYVWGTVDVENEVTNIYCLLNILNVFRIIVIFLL
jgi:septin family protein